MLWISNYIFYCKIKKLFCKLEENLKQPEDLTSKNPIMAGPIKNEDTIYPPPIYTSLSQEFIKLYPKKKIEATKKQTGSCSKSTSTTVLHHTKDRPWVFHPSIIKFLAQVDIQRNLSPDFVVTEVPRRDCYKSVSSSIVIRYGKV